MKTLKKSMLLVTVTCLSVLTYAQVNLGITSTTNAAARAAVNSATATQAAAKAAQASRATASTVSNKAVNLKKNIAGSATTTTRSALHSAKNLGADVKKNANVHANAGISSRASVNASEDAQAGANENSAILRATVPASVEIAAGGNATINGEQAVEKTMNIASEKKAEVNENASQATDKVKATKEKTVKKTRSALRASKEKIRDTNVNGSVELKSETKANSQVNH